MDYYSTIKKNEICRKMGGTGNHYVEQDKPKSKSEIFHVLVHFRKLGLK
jgi:hypothetical protein